MAKYLRLFETEAEYSAATLDYPNVSYIEATDRVSMIKEPLLNVCYGVTENIGTYTSTTYDEVYDKASSNWYMLNNLNQYEQYGVYGNNKTTYYDGKLVVVDNHEWKYTNGAWVDLGEVSGGETSYEFPDYGTMVGTSFPTTFKIAKSYCCGEYTYFNIGFNSQNGNFSFNYSNYGSPSVMCSYNDTIQAIEAQIPYTEDEDYYYIAPDEWTQGVPSSIVVESANGESDCQTPFYVIGGGGISYIEEYTEKAAPAKMLNFNSLAQAKVYSGCVYEGEYANIGGSLYVVSDNVWREPTFTTKNYLRLTAMDSSGATVSLTDVLEESNSQDISYSFDGISWFKWNYSNIRIPNGWTIYFKGNNPNGFNTITTTAKKFNITGTVEANGSVQSLIYEDNFENNLAIPNGSYCFYALFWNCSGLTTAPELPATTLQNYCYNGMFQSCTSLVTAPTLPATTLAERCYNSMFRDCTRLNYIKAMFTTEPSTTYTSSWVDGVAASGTFVKNANAAWDVSGNNGIPTGWPVETASS